MIKTAKYLNVKLRDLTLEDALDAYEDGIIFVCGDGRVKNVINSPATRLLNFITRKDGK